LKYYFGTLYFDSIHPIFRIQICIKQSSNDYFREGHRYGYNWFSDAGSSIFRHGPEFRGETYFGLDDGKLETIGWSLLYGIQWKNTWQAEISYKPQYESIDESFDLSDEVFIPAGDYWFNSVELEVQTDITKSYSSAIQVEIGEFYDGWRSGITIEPTFNINSSLEISGSYEYNRINFDTRKQLYNVHLANLKTSVMFTTKLSIAGLLQYNSLSKGFLGNIRLRYNPREGNDFYIVYNDLVNTDLERSIPFLPRSSERTILLKYSYTFRM